MGYQLSVDNDVSCWVPLELAPGVVLTTGIVYMDQKKNKSNVRSFFKRILKPGKHTKKDQDLKYLQCFDNEGKEIMIPLIMTGVFSPIGEPSDNNYDAVYEMQDLILAFNLPVKAQLIHEEEDQPQKVVPRGLIHIEEVVDEQTVVVGRYPVCGEEDKTFEIPANIELLLRKDLSKKQKSSRKSLPTDANHNTNTQEQIYANSAMGDVELPVRVKESKKQKGLLEKLSVRSKGRKERASLKQMQEAGVFSSRLSRSELNIDDYFTSNDKASNATGNMETVNTESEETIANSIINGFDDNSSVYNPGVESNNSHLKNRDLPPIPGTDKNIHEKDTLYEELPIAPKPPQSPGSYNGHVTDEEDDGYMCPAQLRRPFDRGQSYPSSVVKGKPPVVPRDYTYSKPRKRGEIQSSSVDYGRNRDSAPIDIDRLFNFSSESDGFQPTMEVSPYGQRQFYQATANAQTRRHSAAPLDGRLTSDDSSLQTGNVTNWTKVKSRSQKSLNMDANVTVRSHNMRKVRNVMDVFNVGQPAIHDGSRVSVVSPMESPYTSAIEPNTRFSYYEPEVFERPPIYAASEPGLRRYQRTMSATGLSDIYGNGRNGDDSAFSGDYGYHGDSEYSYNEYSEFRDDGWRPPSDLSNLSVQEVSKSLRYIGMKDRVVIRLANEQIDGQLLCSLDKKLLQEGFPELNALEIKKIIDFINGWRPKK